MLRRAHSDLSQWTLGKELGITLLASSANKSRKLVSKLTLWEIHELQRKMQKFKS